MVYKNLHLMRRMFVCLFDTAIAFLYYKMAIDSGDSMNKAVRVLRVRDTLWMYTEQSLGVLWLGF